MDRRSFIKLGGLAALAPLGGHAVPALDAPGSRLGTQVTRAPVPADHVLRIAAGLVEVAPNRFIATTLYNNQFPGPLLRMREGQPVEVDVHNDTDSPEQVHWHGQLLPVDVDGSAEEGTPWIPARGHRRLRFTPGPSGLRLYHTHTFAGADLRVGLYGGQVGALYVEPRTDPGAYDREVFVVMKEFTPSWTPMNDVEGGFLWPDARDPELEAIGESARMRSLTEGRPPGLEVDYKDFTINGKSLGFGEPIRVRVNEQVLFHVVNGSATEIRSLALPGHVFRVLSLDGNPVPTPADVPVLWIAPGERVSALVHMSQPGVWIMGDVGDDRYSGMGIVVEYAGATGSPAWVMPHPLTWDYTRFGEAGSPARPDHTIDMLFREETVAAGRFTRWLINDASFSMGAMKPAFVLRQGLRYRLHLRNASADIHPVHLHRHLFELTKIAGRPTKGIRKDVVMLGAYQDIEIDFSADRTGLSLFHCHMQPHMDNGFMALFDCR